MNDSWTLDSESRLLAGAAIGLRTGRLKVALIHAQGGGWAVRIRSVEAITMPPPAFEVEPFVDAIENALRRLFEGSASIADEIDILGLRGLPPPIDEGELADRLAERTGITMVSGFDRKPHADESRGRMPAPELDWILFRSMRRHRVFIQLGAVSEVTYLRAGGHVEDALTYQAGPCCEFLDGFAVCLSQGRYPFDPGGHFAVQGRPVEPLIENWMSHPYLLRSPPKRLSTTEFGESFRESSIVYAREKRLSAADLLCSANHFVARSIRESINRWLPTGTCLDEVWVGGGGVRNGLLWKLLREQFQPLPTCRCDDLGIAGEARSAIHAALLAYLASEYLPAGLVDVQGRLKARVLGQITPGSPENFERFVGNLVDRFDRNLRRAA